MDEQLKAIGDRIRSALPAGMSQGELARRVGMPADAMSRAMNAKRGFSAAELTEIGGVLGLSLHWLVTGQPDPFALRVAARHAFDRVTRERFNRGARDDEPIVKLVARVYGEAFPDGIPASPRLSRDPAAVRDLLGDGFVRDFSKRIEISLGVDVVRVPRLSTDYSLTIGPRNVIVLATDQWWFRSNWSLAHELGHLVLSHHLDDAAAREEQEKEQEDAADAFAADLLLPRDVVLKMASEATSVEGLARFVWETGVSTPALRTRLAYLHPRVSSEITEALELSTPKLLRAGAEAIGDGFAGASTISERKQEAAVRRWPADLVAALTDQVEAGNADPQLLADVLDVDVDEIDFPEPPSEEEAAAHYAEMISGSLGE